MNMKGMALINIIMAVLFLAIILGIAAFVTGPLAKRMKAAETGKTIDAAISSIVGYASANRRLPTLAEFTNTVHNANDPWVNGLVYIVDGNMTAIPTGSNEAVCRLKTAGITITSGGTSISNVAFAILSRGANFNNQTAGPGAGPGAVTFTVPNDGTPVDNYAGNGYYDIPGAARPEEYDDIVRWITLDDLKNRIGCYGPTQGRLKILNNELPVAYIGQPYSATVYGDGGVSYPAGGNYRWCVNGTLPPGLGICSGGSSVYNVSNCPVVPEASWVLGNNIAFMNAACSVNGTPTTPGLYNVTVFVRDNADTAGGNDNIAQKSFVITVKPSSWLGGFDNPASPGGTLSGGAAITGTGAAGTASALALIGVAPVFIPTDQGGAGYPKFSFNQTQAFSIMAWVKLTRFPTDLTASNIYPFVSKPGTSPTMTGYYLELHSLAFNPPNTSGRHRVVFRLIGTAAGVGSTVTVYNATNIDTLNVWYHIAASYDGSGTAAGVRIYVNGASGKTAYQDNLGALNITNTNPLTVGYYSAPASWGSNFNSIYIDEVHVYNTEVQRLGATVTGGGVVASPAFAGTSEKINCGTLFTLCEAFYPKNATVILTANPSPGSTFTGWSGGCSGTGTCTIILSADTNVAATFTP